MKKKTLFIMIAITLILIAIIIVLLLTGDKKVTISFNSNGGDKIASIKIRKGHTTSLPTPKKENETFEGWYLEDEKVDSNYKFNEDVELKAKWKDKGPAFTVKFNSDGGDEIDDVKLECGQKLTLPEEPTKKGFTFISWEDDDKKTIRDGEVLACKDITLIAIWDKEDDMEDNSRLTIKFDTKGGNSISSIKVKCKNGILPTLPTPEKNGYNFVSWKYKNGSKYVDGTEIVKCDSFTVYATWEKDPNKYIITFDSKGGSTVNSMVQECNKEIESLPKPTKNNYNFISWVDKNSTPILDGALLSCEDIKLFANWESKYTCTEGTLKENKCIIEKEANSACKEGYDYSEKAAKCIKRIGDADEENKCATGTYKTSEDLGGSATNGCYDLVDKTKNCDGFEDYTLSSGKCVKTIEATLK